MNQFNKLVEMAKANKKLAIFIGFVVVGVIANALGLG